MTSLENRVDTMDEIKLRASQIIINSQLPVLESLLLRILLRREFENAQFVQYEGQIGLKHDGQTKPHFIYIDIDNPKNKEFINYLNQQCYSVGNKMSEKVAKPNSAR